RTCAKHSLPRCQEAGAIMLKRLSRFFPAAPELKMARAHSSLAFYFAGNPVWTPRDYSALSREGFQKNAVVHRSVRLIAEAAASLPLILKQGDAELSRHPVLALLARPNAREGGQ